MALGILFDPIISTGLNVLGKGPLSALNGGSTYDLDMLKYPNNVGSSDVPHYVVFNIYLPDNDPYIKNNVVPSSNVQSRSQNNIDYLSSPGGRQQNANITASGVATAATITGAQAAIQQFSQPGSGFVDSLTSAIGKGLGQTTKTAIAGAAVSELTDTISFKPKIKQIQTSIAVYMPDTIMTSFNHDYGTISATEALGKLGLASALGTDLAQGLPNSIKGWAEGLFSSGLYKQAATNIKNLKNSDAGKEVAGGLTEASGLVGPGYTDLLLKSSGVSINPQVELIYRGTQNRSFIFEFKFQPRSAAESKTIWQIIRTFKMYSSPSINNTGLGRYFIVPGQFDITFKFGNVDNQYISQISTCVLEAIDINHAGAGQFASMTDGAPADITVQLRFKEGEIITRELITGKGF
jgi:hypothetical protein